ncbi:WcaF family extracellular polysaccharide biosynthesis acetyltransferase [Persicitalea sp.]|uniref:WcaF family extracellular polysaccharide biosynthesis acetyltransferase n=1 Tax=Persicitalea sp. TaxID=3100273 RepID=UPI0035938E28
MEKTSQPQTDLSKYNNSWYQPGGWLRRFGWHLAGRVFINTYFPYPVAMKVAILRFFGAKIAVDVMIKPKVNIKYPWFLTIEKNAWIGEKVWIDNLTVVTIGANSCLSQGAMLLTGNHDYKSLGFELRLAPIVLEAGVWIGAQAVVCPGVVCASHAVLSVGSVATKNLDAYGIYGGNPAQFIRNRNMSDEN